MTKNTDSGKAWRHGTDDKLLRVYEAIPDAAKTRFRKGETLRTFESFVECYDRLRARERNSPQILTAVHPEWELVDD
ncbi:hypothetical protein [Myxococcus xanthus]|uniref:hypothetical protein n=1 Tax=Myxococcus xanthus TaxID=34 RepID=UPI00112A2448|nr:hypothetical protein [Myxococcus xanthus]QDE82849.1 hypothetical protein BHS07_15530 [Myxococcus xanthus]